MKIPHSNLFQGEYLSLEGSNYLLVNEYWGSKYFPVNNYWGALFFGEYLLTVTPGKLLGYRAMHLKIRQKNGLNVTRDQVYDVMTDVDLEGLRQRQPRFK